MEDTEFISPSLEEFAKRYHLDYDKIPRQKVVFVKVGTLPAGSQIQIHLPYDQELKDSIITGIRSTQSSAMMNANYKDFPDTVIAPLGAFSQFVFSLCDRDANELIEQLPMYELLQTAGINVNEGIRGMWRIYPENCYITYFDIANTRSGFVFPFIFTFHPIKERL